MLDRVNGDLGYLGAAPDAVSLVLGSSAAQVASTANGGLDAVDAGVWPKAACSSSKKQTSALLVVLAVKLVQMFGENGEVDTVLDASAKAVVLGALV